MLCNSSPMCNPPNPRLSCIPAGANSQQPTANSQQPTANSQQPTVYYPLRSGVQVQPEAEEFSLTRSAHSKVQLSRLAGLPDSAVLFGSRVGTHRYGGAAHKPVSGMAITSLSVNTGLGPLVRHSPKWLCSTACASSTNTNNTNQTVKMSTHLYCVIKSVRLSMLLAPFGVVTLG